MPPSKIKKIKKRHVKSIYSKTCNKHLLIIDYKLKHITHYDNNDKSIIRF